MGTPAESEPEMPAFFFLTSRELQVVQLVANGKSNNDIGAALGVSALTVKSHLARIGLKVGTGDRAGIVAACMRRGLIT